MLPAEVTSCLNAPSTAQIQMRRQLASALDAAGAIVPWHSLTLYNHNRR